MTKQTINLLGGVVVAAIVVLGLLVGVLPRWSAARTADQDRQTVAAQNQNQQLRNTALAAQRSHLPELQADVAALKQQIPSGPHLEQLIEVAATLPDHAVLRSITPGQGDTSGGAPAAPPAPPTSTSDGFAALPITIVIDLRRAGDAASVLDKLRTGPRLLAIDQASVTSGSAGDASPSSTLTVRGRVFMAQAGTPQATPQATPEAAP